MISPKRQEIKGMELNVTWGILSLFLYCNLFKSVSQKLILTEKKPDLVSRAEIMVFLCYEVTFYEFII